MRSNYFEKQIFTNLWSLSIIAFLSIGVFYCYGGGYNKNLLLITQQQKLIQGVVKDSQGVPLPGVSVLIKGKSKGVATDFDGNFSIDAESSDILVFSYVGFATQEVAVKGQTKINVVLKEAAQELDQVVVTALGIKRAEKTLTYSQQKVDSEEITKTKDPNFVNSLAGKTSGIQLTKSAAGAGGSSKIILRGNKSIVGVSNPLFVIDGIPMSSGTPNAGNSSFYTNRDKSDIFSQINPDDIESITVLKGSNAAILYGSQGANGVIMITTKKGKEGRLSGNISSSVTFEDIIELPEMQYRYGNGGSGDVSWDYTKGNYDDSFVKNFFNTGMNVINSISLNGGSASNASYLSYSNTRSEGVVPENAYNKHNLTIKQDSKFLDDKLTLSAKVMLTDEKVNNKPHIGYYFNPITGLYWFPRNMNFQKYKDNYEVLDPSRNVMLQNWHIDIGKQQNPYWIVNNNTSEDHIKRLITSINVGYQFTKNLKLQLRGNYDYANLSYEMKVKAGTARAISSDNGRWSYSKTEDTQMYTDAILTYTKDINDFSLNTLVGSSYERKNIGEGLTVDSNVYGLKFANEFNFQNLNPGILVQNILGSRVIKQSVFGNVEVGYKDMLFLDVSGRNDWASTLAFTDNYSYFYPSFGLSALVHQMVSLPKAMSFMKVRGSYSIISNEVPAFITNPIGSIGANGINPNTNKPFTELKAEEQRSFEVGLDLRLFHNRLGLDITYYNINTENQFLDLDAPSGSGYSKYYVNAGHIRNKGMEVTLNATPIKKDNFTWNSTINYSYNKNEILSLHKDLKGKYSVNDFEGYALYITEGGSFGDIYVNAFERDNQGRILIDDKGAPVMAKEKKLVGNAQPDFLLGWNNSFKYKNFGLSFLFDGKFGGKIVSVTEAMLDLYGVSERTAVARDNGGVMINGVDKNGNVVTKADAATYYKATGARDGIVENYVYDATNIRLRQLALSYTMDLKDKWVFKDLTASIIANNLFFLYKEAPFDPDISMSTGNKLQGIDLYTIPSTRNYGVSVKLNF